MNRGSREEPDVVRVTEEGHECVDEVLRWGSACGAIFGGNRSPGAAGDRGDLVSRSRPTKALANALGSNTNQFCDFGTRDEVASVSD